MSLKLKLFVAGLIALWCVMVRAQTAATTPVQLSWTLNTNGAPGVIYTIGWGTNSMANAPYTNFVSTTNTTILLGSLPSGTIYASCQAAATNYITSPWSTELQFNVLGVLTAPTGFKGVILLP
jgi:hypothetical protein